MKQCLFIAGLVMVFGSSFAEEPTSSVGKLHWRNGETLAGELLSADASTLTWKTPIVSEPAVLDRSRLLFLEFTPPHKNGPVDAHWSLLLRNGDCVHGDGARLANGKVEIHCARHGLLTVPLDQVRSLRRLRGGGDLLYAGPCGQKDWHGPGFSMDGGALATRKWADILQLPMELPERMAADIVLRSTQLLNFKLGFQSVSGVTPTIETWGADVVLAAPAGAATYGLFVPLLKLKGSEAGLSLRIYWDQAANRMQVFDMGGKDLGKLEWAMVGKAKPTETKPGIAIRNRGANWVVDELCVRRWDGQFPKAMPEDLPRVQLADGSWKKGGDLSGLDLESVQSVVWSDEAPPLKSDKPRPAAEYFDGTKLSGQLLSFNTKGFSMKVPWATEPVHGDLAGLLRMIFETPDKPVEETAMATFDRLHSGTFNIHGTVVCDGGKEPRWRFIGGRDALPVMLPDKPEDMEIVFARPLPSPVDTGPAALIIADDGSVLRAGFQALDETGLTFDSPWAKGRSMPHEHLRAVRMGTVSIASKGFRDSEWRLIKGENYKMDLSLGDKPEKDLLKLESGVVYGHPSMVRGDDIRFRFRPAQRYGGVEVEVYADDGESGGNS
ncbi:MAG: resA 3, partial [Verrucomicrobiaceae bacterium]|nr:resA 3 [Verrucomicrobiaceae bacterium]